MIMFNREDFLAKRCNYREYYAQFVTPELTSYVLARIGSDRLLASTREGFADIPLIEWDAMQVFVSHMITPLMQEAGIVGVSLAECNCTAKEAAQQWVDVNKPHFVYVKYPPSIRIAPQNYLVAGGGDFWQMMPDLACPVDMVLSCTVELMKHENKYGSGKNLLAALKKVEGKAWTYP